MAWTDNPVADFDVWDRQQNEQRTQHRVGRCAQCGEDVYDYDDYYDFDGDRVHDDCVIDWIAQFKK